MTLFEAAAATLEFIHLLLRSVLIILHALLRSIVPKSRKSIKNEIVLITGAANGLGKELALMIAQLGATVVLWDIHQELNDAVAEEIRNKGGKAHSYQCDITNEKQVESQAHRVRQDVGDVSVLINNAGILQGQPLICLNNLQIRRTLEINLFGHFWTTKEFLPRMMELSHGHIVAISSVAGKFGQVNMTDYSASKFGVIGFMESLEEELCLMNKDNCINLTTVHPLTMNTQLCQNPTTRFPCLLPIVDVKNAAKATVDGILRNKRYIYIPSRIYFFIFLAGIFPRKTVSLFNRFLGYAVAPNDNVSTNVSTTMKRRLIT